MMLERNEDVASAFSEVAWKYLAAVDLPKRSSNQHEVGGLTKLHDLLGTRARKQLPAIWRIFGADGALLASQRSMVTWYDARETNPNRGAEWRLYYTSDEGRSPLDSFEVGDLLLAVTPGPQILGQLTTAAELMLYVIPRGSEFCEQVLSALELTARPGAARATAMPALDPTRQDVLQRLEPALHFDRRQDRLEKAIAPFFDAYLQEPTPQRFPSPEKFAQFGQALLESNPISDPDISLLELLEAETFGFFELEKIDAACRLAEAGSEVDEVLKISNSILQRRKSRRGTSLEHQLTFIFAQHRLRFETQAYIKARKVDFLFPDVGAYRALEGGEDVQVRMLAAKSTCKERWAQVLQEAPAIKRRHLFTLEQAIPYEQTALMGRENLTLVVPESHVESFRAVKVYGQTMGCGTEILTLRDFIELIVQQIGKAA